VDGTRRIRLEVRLPPKIAYLLAKIALSLGESPSTIAARLLARGVERTAKEMGLDDDWEEAMLDVLEELDRHVDVYLSREAARRILEAVRERDEG